MLHLDWGVDSMNLHQAQTVYVCAEADRETSAGVTGFKYLIRRRGGVDDGVSLLRSESQSGYSGQFTVH